MVLECEALGQAVSACMTPHTCRWTRQNRTASWFGVPARCALLEVNPRAFSCQGFWLSPCWEVKHLTFGCHAVVSTSDFAQGMWKSECTCHRCQPLSDRYRSEEWSQLAVRRGKYLLVTFHLQMGSRQPLHANVPLYLPRVSPSSMAVGWEFMRDSNWEWELFEDYMKYVWKWQWLFLANRVPV